MPSPLLGILMLAWEYPPHVIGGLARAVCDLSRQLAALGHDVHVITCLAPDCPPYEVSEGVHIHRAEVLSIDGLPSFPGSRISNEYGFHRYHLGLITARHACSISCMRMIGLFTTQPSSQKKLFISRFSQRFTQPNTGEIKESWIPRYKNGYMH